MRFGKKIIVLMLAILLVFPFNTNGMAYAYQDRSFNEGSKANNTGIEQNRFDLAFNKDFSIKTGNATIDPEDWGNSVLSITIKSIEENNIALDMELNNGEIHLTDDVKGRIVYTKNGSKYYVTVSGEFKPDAGRDIINTDIELCYSVDFVWINDSVFAVVSIGAAFEDNHPIMLFYGDYSNDTADFYIDCLDYLSNSEQTSRTEFTDVDAHDNMRYNASLVYGGKINLIASNYNLGYVSLFYQAEVERGGTGNIIGKVNSNNANAKTYTQNVLQTAWNEHVSWAQINKIDIKLSTSTGPDLVQVSSHVPLNSSTTLNISGFSIGPISFPNMVINSSTVTESTAQARRWTLYKSSCWSNIDGSPTGSTGVWTEIFTHVNSGTTGNVSYSATVRGRVQYMYAYVDELDNGTYIGSFWVGSMSTSKSTPYTVVDN